MHFAYRTHAVQISLCLFAALLLAACASDTTARIGDAATAPLKDLNIVRVEIPDVLKQAQKHTYLVPGDQSCAALAVQVSALDDVLGSDLDTPETETKPGLIERGTNAAENSAVNAVQRSAEDLVPFRSWIRKLSGAERHSKHVAAAIAAGAMRRAFLKGISAGRDCSNNAAAQS